MDMNEINLDGREQKICRNCVDNIWGQGKSDTLKKVGYITVYGTDESEEDKEEAEGGLLVVGSDEVSVMPVICPPWDG